LQIPLKERRRGESRLIKDRVTFQIDICIQSKRMTTSLASQLSLSLSLSSPLSQVIQESQAEREATPNPKRAKKNQILGLF
jgi:hypothetical protein